MLHTSIEFLRIVVYPGRLILGEFAYPIIQVVFLRFLLVGFVAGSSARTRLRTNLLMVPISILGGKNKKQGTPCLSLNQPC